MHRWLPALALLLPLQVSAAAALDLQRGVGVHEWLNWAPLAADGSYRRPPYQTIEEWRTRYRYIEDWPAGNEFARIRAMGFDFVRLTVDPGPLLADPGAGRSEGLAVLRNAVSEVLEAGLNVVFDYHLVPQVPAFGQEAMEGPVDAPQLQTYRGLLRETAAMLAGLGVDRVAFEPMNEPQYYPCDGAAGDEWERVMASFVATIREVSSRLTIVATGACGGGPDGLLNLDPAGFEDPAILYSFHMYEPHAFTHQGVGDTQHLAGLPWPATARSRADVERISRELMAAQGMSEAEQQALVGAADGLLSRYFAEAWSERQMVERFAEIRAWADGHSIPTERLFLGEFGVTELGGEGGALDEDRLRYLSAVRSLAEDHGMAWSVWEYSNPHGMSLLRTEGPAVPDPAFLRALGLL